MKCAAFVEAGDPGLLIAFEGSDGSGKSTQRKLFKAWLKSVHNEVVVTKWNSSPLFKPLIKARKAARLLDPKNYAVLHAADFHHRYETVIRPSLANGKTVLADRYIFTGITRDVARGMNREWAMNLYDGVRRPDIVFYFKTAVDTCAKRIRATRDMKFYEAGQDVTGLDDPYESFIRFAPKVFAEYDRLNEQFGFVLVDAGLPIPDQHRFIRETYQKRLIEGPTASQLQLELHA